MKRFSTLRWVIPHMLQMIRRVNAIRVEALFCWIMLARAWVIVLVSWLCLGGLAVGRSMTAAGNSVKAMTKAMLVPIAIIQPKSMIGRMLLTIRELKATIVVRAV